MRSKNIRKIIIIFSLSISYSWVIAFWGMYSQNDFDWITFIYFTVLGGIFTYFPLLFVFQFSYDFLLKKINKSNKGVIRYLIGGGIYSFLLSLIFYFFDKNSLQNDINFLKSYFSLFIALVPMLYFNYIKIGSS